MKKVRKAVITAAGRGTRQYPATSTVQKEMIPLVDRDGVTKPTLQIVAEEALDSGIEEICIVTGPGDEENYRKHFQGLSDDLLPAFKGKEWALAESRKLAHLNKIMTYVTQPTPEGFGHAVYQARDFVGKEPFLLMLGDHIYGSRNQKRCARQLIDVYEATGSPVSSVAPTPSNLLHLFGTVKGEKGPVPGSYKVTAIQEKPSIEDAKARLHTDGMAPDEYLCFFGMHVFTPEIFECLQERIDKNMREKNEIQLTSAQEMLRQRTPSYLACEIIGERYDMGIPYGLMETQVALALMGPHRNEILSFLFKNLGHMFKAESGGEITSALLQSNSGKK
jgi:UTP--glucose-1-phosphate uridylyltransferase